MDVYDYLDWRELVRAALQDLGMPQRDLAHAVGVSEAKLSMLLSGQRGVATPELVAKIADTLFPGHLDRAWFEALVDLQASNPRARQAAEAVVRNMLAHLSAPAPAIEIVELQSDWRVLAIMELATCVGFRPDPAWIAAKLVPPIEAADAAALWERLLATRLVTPRPDGGFDVRSVLTPHQLRNRAAVALVVQHRAALALAAESFHPGNAHRRRGSVFTAALSEATLQRIRARLVEMDQELIAMAANDPGPRNCVFMATIQLFPCSEVTDSEDVDEEPRPAAAHRPGDDGPR